MNILDGARLANRQALAGEMGYSQAAAEVVGTAYSVLSIKQALENRRSMVEEETLRKLMANIRTAAIRMQRRAERVEMVLSDKEVELLGELKTGAKQILWRGLEFVGKWFIKGLAFTLRSLVLPIIRMTWFVVSNAFRVVLTNPVLLGILATAGLGYLAWRAINPKARMSDVDPVKPSGNSSDTGRARGSSSTPSSPAAPQAGSLDQRAKESGAASAAQGNGFTVYSVPKASTSTAAPSAADAKYAKGVFRNNPGNVEFAGQEGATRPQNPDGTYSRFATFSSQEEGLYQIGRQLQLFDSRGISSIRDMIYKYAPPKKDGKVENDTASYIDVVSKRTGLHPDKPLDMSDPEVVKELIKAIVHVEVGKAPYTDAQYAEAAKRAVAFRGLNYRDQAWGLQIPTYGRVSSTWGSRLDPVEGKVTRKHKGIDIAAPTGTPVYAAHAGTATVLPNTTGGYGNLLKLAGSPYSTVYAHLSAFEVKNKDQVVSGQLIARVGNTGRSTGAHLHFEVHDSTGEDMDPYKVMTLPTAGRREIAKGSVVLPTAKEIEVIRLNSRLLKMER